MRWCLPSHRAAGPSRSLPLRQRPTPEPRAHAAMAAGWWQRTAAPRARHRAHRRARAMPLPLRQGCPTLHKPPSGPWCHSQRRCRCPFPRQQRRRSRLLPRRQSRHQPRRQHQRWLPLRLCFSRACARPSGPPLSHLPRQLRQWRLPPPRHLCLRRLPPRRCRHLQRSRPFPHRPRPLLFRPQPLRLLR
jgi:hypothetical protein